jgi:hypothetical protein
VEVVAEEAERRSHEGDPDERGRLSEGPRTTELERVHEEGSGGDRHDPRGQSVEAIHEVDRVDHYHDPQNRYEHRDVVRETDRLVGKQQEAHLHSRQEHDARREHLAGQLHGGGKIA